ncbi:MAG: hypothetical protein ACRENS_02790 [Candidatus Eiseniibacteriota bacterium]
MHIPAFSIFSAISELFVTAGVFWVIRRNWTRRPFPFALFLTVALFEALVNVMYMASRSSAAASGQSVAPNLRIFFALHGMLSLLAYLVFVILGVLAYQEQKEGRYWFRDRPAITWTFLVVWTISIGSGEVLFVMRYLLPS